MTGDPLAQLRAYRQLAPWNVRDLSATAAGILAHARVRPVSASAAVAPAERTIRFYVVRGLVSPPEGRGTAATYSYRHLLQVLAVKLRQMEGAALGTIGRELRDLTGDVLERRVAAALGERLPPPELLGASAGRAFHATPTADGRKGPGEPWRRIAVLPGVELHVRDGVTLDPSTLADRVREALADLGEPPSRE